MNRIVAAPSESIARAIERLRSLSQVSLQSSWRYWEGDLSLSAALQVNNWNTWTPADRNSKDHLAWAGGRVVRWFSQRLVVPEALQGYPLAGLCCRLALLWWAREAQVFVNGELVQEGDLFDCAPRLQLSPSVTIGSEFAIAVRLVSPGHDDGALMRSACHYEVTDPSAVPEPAFVASELEVLQTYVTAFAPEQLAAIATAVNQLEWSAVQERSRFDQSLAQLRQTLLPLSDLLKQRTLSLLGHAHLDMAWLWTVDETWRAAERTFESVLHLQQTFPELTFCHSTPALYEWVEQHRPELFDRLRQAVHAGTWEAVGAMWIEPEMNLVGGEAIVRHLLYGQRYLQRAFGSTNRIAWLPDTFGFNWQLPQFLRLGGIEYFVTQKLRWNDTTPFPYELFRWQAPNGSQVLSLMSAPIGEGIDPVKMAAYACDWEQKTGRLEALWLPGVGDHGGGPTRDMLEVAQRWQRSPFFPQLQFTTALEYLQRLDTPVTPTLPVWHDELYLEFHRGCYTTHADQKQANRLNESLLFQAELWAAIATIATGAAYPQAELETAWKQLLFNQFHDILPGSSIREVFVEANDLWQQVESAARALQTAACRAIAAQIQLPPPPHPAAQAIVVFNPLNWPRSLNCTVLVDWDNSTSALKTATWEVRQPEGERVPEQVYLASRKQLMFSADDVPAVGYRCFWVCPAAPALDSSPTLPLPTSSKPAFVLENEYLRVTVNPSTGDLDSIFDKQHQREVLAGAGNQLQAFHDRGQYWDAWNIDPNYAQHPLAAVKLLAIHAQLPCEHQTGLDSTVRVDRQIGQSLLQQTYRLQPGAPLLHVDTFCPDWQERHVLVKAAFPLHLVADRATYEIPCGAIARPTQPQSDREAAQWEVPALRWADLSDGSYGMSLLTDSKHGFDSQPQQLRLTLLRGSEFPDPDADKGEHRFTYVLYPHAGTWQAARTVHHAAELTTPAIVLAGESVALSPHPVGELPALPPVASLLNLGAENLILMALKQAESGSDWVLRCYEAHGEPAQLHLTGDLTMQIAETIDLLEQPFTHLPEPEGELAKIKNQGQTLTVQPWQIVSLKVFTNRNTGKSVAKMTQ